MIVVSRAVLQCSSSGDDDRDHGRTNILIDVGRFCMVVGVFSREEVRTPSAHHSPELVEEVTAIMGAGRGLGVILDAEDGQACVPQSFQGLIVQVDVAGLDVGGQAWPGRRRSRGSGS